MLEELYLDSKVSKHCFASRRAHGLRCEICKGIMHATSYLTLIYQVSIEDKQENILKPNGMDALRKCLLALVIKERGY
jgi:hypothetical protein